MKRNPFLALAVTAFSLFVVSSTRAQKDDPPKYEVGGEFSVISRDDFSGGRLDAGAGARFTFNLTDDFAIEGAGYYFPNRCFSCDANGTVTMGVAGVKYGKRFEKWGIFGKARPGVVSYSEGAFFVTPLPGGGPFPFSFETRRTNHFALDVGGVLEFYPTRKIVTRFDVGDTIVHHGQRTESFLVVDPVTGAFVIAPVTSPARTRHNFQFSAGVGFRF
jgi:hypothetical protein